MKNTIILVALVLTSAVAFAGTKTKKTISAEQFIKEVSNYVGDMSSTKANAFRGELAEVGGECFVTLEKDNKGRLQVVLSSEKGFQIDAIIGDEKVKVITVSDSDGSFSSEYTFGFMGLHRLDITHVDDAYDHVTFKAGTTTLSCEADY